MTTATLTQYYEIPRLFPSYIAKGTATNTPQTQGIDRTTLDVFGQGTFFQILAHLLRELSEYTIENWDGYGAERVEVDAIANCAAFLTRLQDVDLFDPSADVEPDGRVTLEWYLDPSNLLRISLDDSETATYACLIDGEGHCGDISIDKKFRGTVRALFSEFDRRATRS